MYKLSNIPSKYISKLLNLLVLILILVGGFWLYYNLFGYHIRVRFEKLVPLAHHIPVYCKGKKIGETRGVTLNRDYKFSTLKILLFPQRLSLPENTMARIKKFDDDKDYIEMVYPTVPSKAFLKSGDTVIGKIDLDKNSLIAAIGDAEDVAKIVDKFSDMLADIDEASQELTQFFILFSGVLEDNRANIKQVVKNAAAATSNMDEISTKFNNSIKEDSLKNTISNIDKSSGNIKDSSADFKESAKNINEVSKKAKEITNNVNNATKNIDTTVAIINATVCDAKVITSNVKCITCVIKEALRKRFAGVRILFGKPLN